MAWDIFIQDLPDVKSVKEIPEDFRPQPIGLRAELVQKITDAVPFVERQDNDWLFVQTPDIDLSISLVMEEGTEEVRYIAIHVHGGGQSAACVAAIVERLQLRALDTATGEFFDPTDPGHGYADWSRYKDQVLKRPSHQG